MNSMHTEEFYRWINILKD